jgi:DNA-directed RNA polymerase sigma subunit (sigma70/sigma32)
MVNDILQRFVEERTPRRTLANFSEQTEKVLSTLAPREEMILRMRFGIRRRTRHLEDLSRQFSLTCKRIRQIEVEALRKLREKTRCFYSKLHHEWTLTSAPALDRRNVPAAVYR